MTVHRQLALALLVASSVVTLTTSAAHAQRLRGPDRELSMNADALKGAFKDVVASTNKSTVLIRCDGKNVAVGTVISADGYVLTKASELLPNPSIVIRDAGGIRPAKVVGVAEDHDLALLKADLTAADAGKLAPVQWADARKAVVGQWVATTGMQDAPAAIGVMSVGRRKIPARSGMLGVMLADGDGGAKVMQVVPESPAERAGLRADDVIAKVNDKAVDSRESLIGTIKSFMPGQEVTLAVKRGEKEMRVTAKLAGGFGPGAARSDMMNQMGGPLSLRNANFPAVLQHDTVLTPMQCGGPLVGLDGKAVGVNIARAGRVETYAVPADVIVALLPDLRSGKLAPKSQDKPTTKPAERKNEE